jgi:hypothetical protein
MSLPSISTGLPIVASTDPGSVADSDRAPWTRLFDFSSSGVYSHVVDASTFGLCFMGFGLEGTDKLTVQMVVGPNEGDLFQDLSLGTPVELSASRTLLFIPAAGRYRLKYTGDRLSMFHAFVSPVPIAAFPGMASLFQQFGG